VHVVVDGSAVTSLQGEDNLMKEFAQLASANKSASTITAYRTDLAQFAYFLSETNRTIVSPADVTRVDVAEYLAHLAERDINGTTRARKLAAIREFFRFLRGEGLITANPTTGVTTPKKERGSRSGLRSDEYTKLLSLAGANPRDYAILQVFLPTGIRVSERCGLTRSDIDLDARRVHIGNVKGQKARTIELEKRGIQAIKSYLAVRPESLHDELFLNYQGQPLLDRAVRKMLVKYLTASGITKKISPHSLRHTFAPYGAERGVSPYVLREWLGHAQLDTTQIYVHMARENTKKAMEATSL
jgi:integrase/recombinase XerC